MAKRPIRFEHFRYLGDKRTQIVWDMDDDALDQSVIDELVASGQGATFGPDTLPEARNRGYRLAAQQAQRAAQAGVADSQE